jgi:hypothetical protein
MDTNDILDEEICAKIEAHFSPHFSFEHDVRFAGERLVFMAQMHSRQQRALMGFKMDGMGPQASEFMFAFKEDVFDVACLARMDALLGEAMRTYGKSNPDQAYTFLSVIVIAGSIDSQAETKLKKSKGVTSNLGRKGGWTATRAVVIGTDKRVIGNRDSKEFKSLLQKLL